MQTISRILAFLVTSTLLVALLQLVGPAPSSARSPAVPGPNRGPLAHGLAALTTQTFPAGNAPYAIAFDGTRVWVANYFGNNISLLRASDGASMGTYGTGTFPAGIAFDGTRMWISNNGAKSVRVLASDGSDLQTVNVGASPIGVAYDGTNTWVANWGNGAGNSVSVLRGSDYGSAGTYTFGPGPFALTYDGSNIWVANDNGTLSVLQAIDGYHVMTPTVGSGLTLGLAFDGANVWASNWGDNSVSVIRASDGYHVMTPTVGTNPFGMAFDGTYMWIANTGDNTVSVVRASDGLYFTTVHVGTHPQGVVFDGSSIWVANNGSNNVTKISGSVPLTPDATWTGTATHTPTATCTPFLGAYLPLVARQPTPTFTATPTRTPTPTQTFTPIPNRPRLIDGYYRGALSWGGEVEFHVSNGGNTASNGYYSYPCPSTGGTASWFFLDSVTISNGYFRFEGLLDNFHLAHKRLECTSSASTQVTCSVSDVDASICHTAVGWANWQY